MPAERGKTGSLATCIQPGLRGHFVGTVVGDFADTFVSISVSIFVYTTCFYLQTCPLHMSNILWPVRCYETSVFFVGHSVSEWPASEVFVTS